MRICRRARELRSGKVELAHEMLATVITLRDRRGVEGVGLDDVRARLEIRLMHCAHDAGLGATVNVVVDAQLRWTIAQACAAERGLVQAVTLQHGAHRAVEHQHAPREQFFESPFVHALAAISAPMAAPAAFAAGRMPSMRQMATVSWARLSV